jgi:hypothetical protein
MHTISSLAHTWERKVHSVSEANTCFSHLLRKISLNSLFLRSLGSPTKLVSSAAYWGFLYIKLFPYTKAPKSSLSAPLCIGNSSISSYFPIPKLPKASAAAPQRAFSVFLSKSSQKHRLFQLVSPAPSPKVCVLFPFL